MRELKTAARNLYKLVKTGNAKDLIIYHDILNRSYSRFERIQIREYLLAIINRKSMRI